MRLLYLILLHFLLAVVSTSAPVPSVPPAFKWNVTAAPNGHWNNVFVSADGGIMAAAINGGGVYISVDGGVVWTEASSAATSWTRIAGSSSGKLNS